MDLASLTRSTHPELQQRYRSEGLWDDDTLGLLIERTVTADPALAIRVWSDDRSFSGTAGELYAQALRLAGGLRAHGIGTGDVVAYQLPNWAETLVTLWAGALAGVALVPIVHFYGPHEVSFILGQSDARAIITVDSWGGVDQLANLESIRGELPALEVVAVVQANESTALPTGAISFVTLLESDAVDGPARIDPDHPSVIAYTSGTTADPKGVMHTNRTLLAEARQQTGATYKATRPMLNAAPLAHMAGMLGGALLPLYRGEPIHLIDRWDPGRALDVMELAGVRLAGGPPIFLTSLLDHPRFADTHRSLISVFGMGGAPIPLAVAERAESQGIHPWRAYGSTEHPTITQCDRDAPAAIRLHTDGAPRAGVEVRLVDDALADVDPGMPGEILSRGPELFCGYTDPSLTEAAVDGDGWYHTGDIGVLDEAGNLSITDRLGDLIIRGGRNLSGTEIESHLLHHPDIAEVAVVAAPHTSLGETACAFIRLHAGADPPNLDAVLAHLRADGVSKQKWPEDLRVVGDFPRTPTGKIRKNELRAELRGEPR